MLDPNDGSCNCRFQKWVNYMLAPNDGSAICAISAHWAVLFMDLQFRDFFKTYSITQTKLNLVDVERCGARFVALRHPLTVSDCLDRPDNDGTETSPLTCESS